ncbi:hypothetical protein GTQ34_09660 [Muricauda sp. JGD-17]|uniref:BLUF domain-containing protein n=1 Tax=Flagellimonas ochracea TaxID=2696472 RepID=A0A964WXL6_9FLAO|nr:BLUF domain-containing protein [Allomuricauda ochracea]NAY92185.1 hypothetical protein [Allomuricauda ochracea]
MFCLVYKSQSNPLFGYDQIKEMLEKAREFNKENAITGCLLYYERTFLQYLEGNQIDVLKLFDRINADDRHSDVRILCHSHIDERKFKSWDMAYEDLMGENDHLQFLKLLVSSYTAEPIGAIEPNPSSMHFWNAAKRLLEGKESHRIK